MTRLRLLKRRAASARDCGEELCEDAEMVDEVKMLVKRRAASTRACGEDLCDESVPTKSTRTHRSRFAPKVAKQDFAKNYVCLESYGADKTRNWRLWREKGSMGRIAAC